MSLGRVPKGYESETKNVVTTARKKLKDLLKKCPVSCVYRPKSTPMTCACCAIP